MKPLKDQVSIQVENNVFHLINDLCAFRLIRNQIWTNICDYVWATIWIQIGNQVENHVKETTMFK